MEPREELTERLKRLHAEVRELCADYMEAQRPGDEPRLSLILAMEHLNNAKVRAERKSW